MFNITEAYCCQIKKKDCVLAFLLMGTKSNGEYVIEMTI